MEYIEAYLTLLTYVILATPVLPLLPTLYFIGNKRILEFWLKVDMTLCHIVHEEKGRTISGYVGQHAPTSKKFTIVAKVIDWIFKITMNQSDHCAKEYRYEEIMRRKQWKRL